MADDREFRVRVPLRCFSVKGNNGSAEICGELARWQSPGPHERRAFRCDAHQQPGDEPIAFPAIVPPVSLVIELTVSGTSWNPGVAKGEALDRLIEAVGRVGGVLNLHSVLLTTGKYLPPVPDPAPNASEQGGKGRGVRQ